jgi:hypothetical protein
MVSIQTNLSALTAFKKDSFQAQFQAVGKKKQSYSVTNQIVQFSFEAKTVSQQTLGGQNAFINFNQLSNEEKSKLFFRDTPISELSSEEAADLIKEDGYFGIEKTSQRIIDFVIKGAGNDIDRLKAGREGVLRGFSEAGKAWGNDLPEMSYKTIEKSIKALDERIAELGGSPTKISV